MTLGWLACIGIVQAVFLLTMPDYWPWWVRWAPAELWTLTALMLLYRILFRRAGGRRYER